MSWASQAVRTDEMLVTAATRGEYDRVKQYLDHGAVSSARNHHLLTALHWAVTMGHIDVVQLLVDRGADVDAKAADGNSPLHMAAREGDLPCAEFLIGAGADPCGLNSQSQTPLDLANVWAEEELELLHLLRQATQAKAQRQRLGGGSARALAAPSAPKSTGAGGTAGPAGSDSTVPVGAAPKSVSCGCGTSDDDAPEPSLVGAAASAPSQDPSAAVLASLEGMMLRAMDETTPSLLGGP